MEIYEYLNTVGHKSALRVTISGHTDDNKCDSINFVRLPREENRSNEEGALGSWYDIDVEECIVGDVYCGFCRLGSHIIYIR